MGTGQRGNGFLPTQVNSCVLWLRADQGITLATGVSQWNDLSGRNNNVAQATGGTQPGYVSGGGSGGQPYLTFSGQHLDIASNLGITTNVTMFCVNQSTLASSTRAMLAVGGSGTGYAMVTGASRIAISNSGGLTGTDGAATLQWEQWTMQVSGSAFTTLAMSLRVNGILQAISPSTGSGTALSAASTIGTSGNQASLTGNIAECIIYARVLSAVEINAVEGYLQSRYQLKQGP